MVGHVVLKYCNWKSEIFVLLYITSDFQNALIRSNRLENKEVIEEFNVPLIIVHNS